MGADMEKKEEGFMILESTLLLIGFFVLAFYLFDFFAVIHTTIVNQTHARTYMFESLQHRTNIDELRNEKQSNSKYSKAVQMPGYRFHTITTEKILDPQRIIASDVKLTGALDVDNNSEQTSQVWIKAGYGMCYTKGCQ